MPAMMKLESNDFGTYLIVADNGDSRLIQSDWDFPGTARSFGWDMRDVQQEGIAKCEHDETDGTVTCPRCGLTATDFISAAGEWLDDNIGAEAEDPGYFRED
jgi:hypothetical protein